MEKRLFKSMLPLFFAIFAILPLVYSQGLPTASPEQVGLSSERLKRMSNVMQQYVDQKRLSGAVILIARHGKVAYLETLGMADIEAGKAMEVNSIFRIASMSKPITSAAAMMLYEEGKFVLSDPVSKYIPEFKNPHVLVPSANGESYTIVPAKSEITIRNLLNHTAGITYQGNTWVGKMYADAGITSGLMQTEGTIGEKMKLLGKIPLVNQPGEAWEYGLNIDVLGYLVEVWSGMTLDEFLRERIFKPLGMNDTYFFLPEDKVSRMAAIYTPTDDGQIKKMADVPIVEGAAVRSSSYPYQGPRTYFSGGGGLSSTAPDYFRFLQMILNKGQLNGTRLLSRVTVELMTTNTIGDLYILKQPGFKFGLGFGIREQVGGFGELESPGDFGWGGAWYTHTFVNPKEDMIGIFMTQLKNVKEPILSKFVNLSMQSISD